MPIDPTKYYSTPLHAIYWPECAAPYTNVRWISFQFRLPAYSTQKTLFIHGHFQIQPISAWPAYAMLLLFLCVFWPCPDVFECLEPAKDIQTPGLPLNILYSSQTWKLLSHFLKVVLCRSSKPSAFLIQARCLPIFCRHGTVSWESHDPFKDICGGMKEYRYILLCNAFSRLP